MPSQDDGDAIKQSEQGVWDAFSVEDLLHRGIASQLETLQTISVNASKEYGLEKALDKMHADWEGLEFKIMDYKDTGTYIVGGTDDIQVMHFAACLLYDAALAMGIGHPIAMQPGENQTGVAEALAKSQAISMYAELLECCAGNPG